MVQLPRVVTIGRRYGSGSLQPATSYYSAGDVPFRIKRGSAARFASHRGRLDADQADEPPTNLESNEAAALDWFKHLFCSDLAYEFIEIPPYRHLGAVRPVIIYGYHLATRL